MSYVKIGVAGPVGSGKTALLLSQMIFIQKKMHSFWLRTVCFL